VAGILQPARHLAAPIAPWNCLISSTVWRQDHNGFTHQDPGFIDLAGNKSGDVVRVYLPADANCLLAVAEDCWSAERRNIIVIVADKQKHLQYLPMEQAIVHVAKGIGIWAGPATTTAAPSPMIPDVVMACAGDIPTKESLAATEILREEFPYLKIRVINIVVFKLFALTQGSTPTA
jgi:xylulose-5-phosphate/fructose-6-phosphate phosphoketolase